MAIWTPTGHMVFDKIGRPSIEVKYTNQSDTTKVFEETIDIGGMDEKEFRAKVRKTKLKLESADDLRFKIVDGVIDTTPIPDDPISKAEADRRAYDAAYRAHNKAQQAVKDKIIDNPNDKTVTDKLAEVKRLFKPEYLDS